MHALDLKEKFKNDFLIGSAINAEQFYERDQKSAALVKAQFNSITSENVLKWESVHPNLNEYTFEQADKFVSFGEKNHMAIIGHTLIWHMQTPSWVFVDPWGNTVDREELLKRMRNHIHTIVGHYKGRILGWDIVNEAINDDGTMRESPWLTIIGEDYIIKAFEYAHEADPEAQLYYNDYGLENLLKRAKAVDLIKKLQKMGIPITAIGLQEHNSLEWPSIQEIENTLVTFGNLGIKVNITELDVDVLPKAYDLTNQTISEKTYHLLNPYVNGMPESVNLELAKRYVELFQIYLKHSKLIDRVTFWGVTDQDSWLNYFPIKGRTNYPLLFNRQGEPKLAFNEIISMKEPFYISKN